ncbi:MAG TPA: response regulator [Dissulfurispiraceae bacterium]
MIKVMIIDDEAQITAMLKKALSRNKELSVSVFNNPLEALRQVPSEKPDVVLLDIMMPQMDGIEALAEIQKNSPGTKVIMMTAYSTLDRVLASHKKGATDFILKPFESLGAVEKKIVKLFQ